MDIAFHGGLTYADVVDLNFSLTVDPLASRPPSNGPDKAAIILQPICVQNVINDYPAVDSVAQRCGDFATINISLSPISEAFVNATHEVDEVMDFRGFRLPH